MKRIRLIALASAAVALALPASAQDVDAVAPGSGSTNARTSLAPAPTRTVHSGANTKAVLAPFGPYITQTGVGSGGADVSELYTQVGYSTWGWGWQKPSSNFIADNFVVPAGQNWTVSAIKWLGYQTNAPTSGSYTGLDMNLWTTNPLNLPPGGQSTTGGNQYQTQTWTGVYRLSDTALTNTQRAIIEVTCNGNWVPALAAGTYWLEAAGTGSSSFSGPWIPPVTVAGQVPGGNPPYDAMQSVAGGAYVQLFDGGSGEPVDFLFQIEGTGGGGGGAPSFCQSKPSSLPGCTPTLSAPAGPITKGGAGGETAVATPAPGGGQPGLVIFSVVGQTANPINTQFGELCIQSFLRASAFAKTPGGTTGSCNGTYTFDLAGIVNAYAPITAGGNLWLQVWYRDPGSPPGLANFTNGVGPIPIN